MYCPNCGQQQISEETRFCSRCGFLMTGVAELIAKGGALPQYLKADEPKPMTPRRKGLKQGGMLFLSSFLIVPILAIITIFLNVEPYGVAIAAILTFWGGILRMIYALLFESNAPDEKTLEENVYQSAQTLLNKRKESKSLPQQSVPESSYVPPVAGNWRDTNDLNKIPSVTEHTTKHLEIEKDREK